MIRNTPLFSLAPTLFAALFVLCPPVVGFTAAAAAVDAHQVQPPITRMVQGTVRSDEHLAVLKNAILPNARALKRIVQSGFPFSADTSKAESYEAAFRILVNHASTNNADLKLKIVGRTGNAQLLAQWGFYPAQTPLTAHLQYVLGKLDRIWIKRNAAYSPENLKVHQIGKNYLYYVGVWLACLKTDLYDRGFLAPADRNFKAAWAILEEATQYTQSKTLNLFKAAVLLKGKDSFNPYDNEEMRNTRAQAFYEAYKAVEAGGGIHHGGGANKNTNGIGCIRPKTQFLKDTAGRELLIQVEQALANNQAPEEDLDNHDYDYAGDGAPSPHPSQHSDHDFLASADDSNDSDGGDHQRGAQDADQESDDVSGCSSPRSHQSVGSSHTLSELAEEDAAVQSPILSDTMDVGHDTAPIQTVEGEAAANPDEDEAPIPPSSAKRRAAAAALTDSDDEELPEKRPIPQIMDSDDEDVAEPSPQTAKRGAASRASALEDSDDEDGTQPAEKRTAREQTQDIKRKTKEEVAQEKHAFMKHLEKIYKKPDDDRKFTGASLAKKFSLANMTSLNWIKEYADIKGFPTRKGSTSGQTAKTRNATRKKFIAHLEENYKQACDYKKFNIAQLAKKFSMSSRTAGRLLRQYADDNGFLIPKSRLSGITLKIMAEKKAEVMTYLEENYKHHGDYGRFRPVDLMREFSLSITTVSNYVKEYETRKGFPIHEAPNKGLTRKIKADRKAEIMAYLEKNYKQREDRKKVKGTMLAEMFSIHPGTARNHIREYAIRKGFLSRK